MEPFTFCESYLLQPSLASAFVCLFISATFAHLTLPLLPLLLLSPVSISCFFFVPPFLTFYLFFLVLCWRRPSSCLSDSPNPNPTPPPLPAPFCICKSLLFASQNFYRFSFCARKGKRYMTGFCLFSVSCVKFGTLIFMLVIFSVSCRQSHPLRVSFLAQFSFAYFFFIELWQSSVCWWQRGCQFGGGGVARAAWDS